MATIQMTDLTARKIVRYMGIELNQKIKKQLELYSSELRPLMRKFQDANMELINRLWLASEYNLPDCIDREIAKKYNMQEMNLLENTSHHVTLPAIGWWSEPPVFRKPGYKQGYRLKDRRNYSQSFLLQPINRILCIKQNSYKVDANDFPGGVSELKRANSLLNSLSPYLAVCENRALESTHIESNLKYQSLIEGRIPQPYADKIREDMVKMSRGFRFRNARRCIMTAIDDIQAFRKEILIAMSKHANEKHQANIAVRSYRSVNALVKDHPHMTKYLEPQQIETLARKPAPRRKAVTELSPEQIAEQELAKSALTKTELATTVNSLIDL